MKKVYLDNAATTMVDPVIVKEMNKYHSVFYGNASSIHHAGQEAKKALEKSRAIIAKQLGAKPYEIIFTSGGTESDNLAIRGIAYEKSNRKQNKNHIITSKIEHPAVLNTCKQLEKEGFKVDYIDVNKEGIVDAEEIKKRINSKTCLVTIMHSNNEIGTIQPVHKIAGICNKNEIPFHTDAVQSFKKTKINLNNISLLSLSAHKIHGPKGVGALYIKEGTRIQKIMSGGHHEFDLRPGTENIPAIAGFAKVSELKTPIAKIKNLRNYMIKELLEIKGSWINGSMAKRLCNNINISFKAIEGEALVLHLSRKGIAASTGSACSSKSLEPSHVLLATGLKPEDCHGSLRLTLSKYTTKSDVDYAVREIKKAVEQLRKISPFAHSVR